MFFSDVYFRFCAMSVCGISATHECIYSACFVWLRGVGWHLCSCIGDLNTDELRVHRKIV